MIRALLLALAVAGCVRPPPPVPASMPRYTVGTPYQLGGLWSYPREDFSAVETGLAVVLPDRSASRRTANGEIFDPGALVAAHRTLPLPAVVVVTNLETGLQVAVRVNDRGPERAGRVLGLSRRAAALLGMPEGGAAQVRVVVDAERSRALAASLPSDVARPAVAAAPVGDVQMEALAAVAGVRLATGVSPGRSPAAASVTAPAAALPALRLPEAVSQVGVAPGLLVLELGRFFRRDLASRQAARLGGRVEPVGVGREQVWRVVVGPFQDVAAADRAVAGVVALGAAEVALRVE